MSGGRDKMNNDTNNSYKVSLISRSQEKIRERLKIMKRIYEDKIVTENELFEILECSRDYISLFNSKDDVSFLKQELEYEGVKIISIEDIKKKGQLKFYYDDRDDIKKLKRENKNKNGKWIIFSSDKLGIKKERGYYNNNIRNGKWEFYRYNEKGDLELTEEGYYYNGKKEGVWSFYQNNLLIREEKFENDKCKGIVTVITIT